MAEAELMPVADADGVVLGQVEEFSSAGALAHAEVDMQVTTAKRYPRSIKRFLDSAMSQVTLDEETAASCFYTLPRKKKDEKTGKLIPISGPSVRLAEIAVCSYENIRAEAKPLDEGERFVTAQATVWDVEKNVLVRVESKRRITDRDGRRYNDDGVQNTMNAAASIAYRNAAFKVIPRVYISKLDKAARGCAVGTIQTLPERLKRALEWFSKLMVQQEQVLLALSAYTETEIKGLADITLEHLEILQGWRTALMDEQAKVEDIFPPAPMPEGKTPLKAGKKPEEPPEPPKPKATPKAATPAQKPAEEKADPAPEAPADVSPAEGLTKEEMDVLWSGRRSWKETAEEFLSDAVKAGSSQRAAYQVLMAAMGQTGADRWDAVPGSERPAVQETLRQWITDLRGEG